jgi:hypothetical protein
MLEIALMITLLKMNLCFIWARMDVFAMMHINTIIASCIICTIEAPLANMLMAAAPPKQLCTSVLKVAEPIKF